MNSVIRVLLAILALALLAPALVADGPPARKTMIAISLIGKGGGGTCALPVADGAPLGDAFPPFPANPEDAMKQGFGGQNTSGSDGHVVYISRPAYQVVLSDHGGFVVRVHYSIYWGDTKKIDHIARTLPVWTGFISDGFIQGDIPAQAKRIPVDRDLQAMAYLAYID